jgi:hypothetical protein
MSLLNNTLTKCLVFVSLLLLLEPKQLFEARIAPTLFYASDRRASTRRRASFRPVACAQAFASHRREGIKKIKYLIIK